MKRKILCIGQTCVDVTVDAGALDGAFAPGGARVDVWEIGLSLGGDATNVSIALQKLGYPVTLVSGAEDGALGDALLAALGHYGLDTSAIVRTGKAKAASVIFRFETRGRTIFNDVQTGADFPLPTQQLVPGGIVALCSFLRAPLHVPEKIEEFVKNAKAMGCTVCADTYTVKDPALFRALRPVFRYIDYFFPNDEELLRYSGAERADDACRYLLDWGCGTVVMKTGKDGCPVRGKAGDLHVPAFRMEQIADTTGCGDNFMAGFLTGLYDGCDIETCCVRANAAAAICTQYPGASTSPLSAAMLDEFIRAHETR